MAKLNLQKIVNGDIKNMFDSVQSSLDNKQIDKSSKELKYIFRYITECVQNLQEYHDPNDINLESQNNSNYQNYYFEDESSKADKQGPKSSYITQNYEKYKQQQVKDVKPTITSSTINTGKSSLYNNLMNKTPVKEQPVSDQKNNSSMKIQQFNPKTQVINPNPLTSHLKAGSFNNDNKYVNKFFTNK